MDVQRPPLLYLDQKDWIALARVHVGKAGALSSDVKRLVELAASGRIVLPFSESHVLETGGIGQPRQREDIATTILVLSRRNSIAPLHALWRHEANSFFWRRLGASKARDVCPFGRGLLFALGVGERQLTPPWPPDASEAEIALAEMWAIAEPSRLSPSAADLDRRHRWDRLAKALTQVGEELRRDRAKYNEQDRLAAATLTMFGNDYIHHAIAADVADSYIQFVRSEGPWAVVQEHPSLAVLTELHRLRYKNAQKSWNTNDIHDLRFLGVALAYCDGTCPDRYWADISRRSQVIVKRGCIVSAGRHAIVEMLDKLHVA